MKTLDIITAIFNSVGSAITAFSGSLSSAVTSISGMFYTAETGALTFLGVLLTIAMGVGVVYWGFKLIKSLIKNRGQ